MAAEGSTVLGKSIQVRGEISGAEDVIVHGRLQGSVALKESRLTVGPDAEVEAELHVHDAILLGRVNGNVTATGRVELRKGASLMGDLNAARLSIEEGSAIQGRVSLSGTKE
ncbi:polymer-forming cytoskeletal protein [Terriglobus sp. RCC_193]|uniref:bactofilin family protein n=1 Tax=Terriglobus sp. RCC_193 TaxID=3239218 RepID=UPI003524DDFB